MTTQSPLLPTVKCLLKYKNKATEYRTIRTTHVFTFSSPTPSISLPPFSSSLWISHSSITTPSLPSQTCAIFCACTYMDRATHPSLDCPSFTSTGHTDTIRITPLNEHFVVPYIDIMYNARWAVATAAYKTNVHLLFSMNISIQTMNIITATIFIE